MTDKKHVASRRAVVPMNWVNRDYRLPMNWATTNSRSTRGLQPEIKSVLPDVASVVRSYSGKPMTITGGQEYGHGFFSLHHSGFAVDIRTLGLRGGPTGAIARQIEAALKKKLGNNYFIQLEGKRRGEQPHIHIQYRWGIRISPPVDFNILSDRRAT